MPRQRIIVLDQVMTSTVPAFRIAAWFDIPAARQAFYASPTIGSSWKDALPADVTALQSGAVLEEVYVYEPGQARTLGQIQADLAASWTARQAVLNGSSVNAWTRYGSTFDGTTWTMTGVA